MGDSYFFRAAIEEGRRLAREKKKRELEADQERQAKKRESLESMNSVKRFREDAERMKEVVLGDNIQE